jgi:hypothetical protein
MKFGISIGQKLRSKSLLALVGEKMYFEAMPWISLSHSKISNRKNSFAVYQDFRSKLIHVCSHSLTISSILPVMADSIVFFVICASGIFKKLKHLIAPKSAAPSINFAVND